MTTIQSVYINALLADAAYVDINPLIDLEQQLKTRMTPTLAEFIGDNFSVLSSVTTPGIMGSGFDATVWKGKPDTDYAGKVYISMRGSQQMTDFRNDIDLTFGGPAGNQLVDMVNWWLKVTTPAGQSARQIQLASVFNPTAWFAPAPSTLGTGEVAAADLVNGRVEVDGHSLGGYLASAFTRLFGAQAHVTHTTTFNSAGFAPAGESVFTQLEQMIGVSYGTGSFPSANSPAQTNVFATHGLNFTTNSFWFNQVGQRLSLFNEQSSFVGTDVPNHFMYKLTDALALATAMSKLDPSLTTSRANSLFEAGSNGAKGSLEGVLDGLRRLLRDPATSPLVPGDVPESADSRVKYHEALKALTDSDTCRALAGKVSIALSGLDLASAAPKDFAALLSLLALSPVALKATAGNEAAVESALASAWSAAHTSWQADKDMTRAERDAGKETYTQSYLDDRASMVSWIVYRNTKDNTAVSISDFNAPDQVFRDFGATANTEVRTGSSFTSDSDRRHFLFGGESANTLVGGSVSDHLYGGAGADTLDGQGGADYLEGNTGDDSLIGGVGSDTLLGGSGADTLDGGKDADTLKGGDGNDTYHFAANWGKDTILDSDGLGLIQVDGVGPMTGANTTKIAPGVWQTTDKKITYTLETLSSTRNNLSIAFADHRADTIVIQNWTPDKNVGITELPDQITPPTARDLTVIGDFAKAGANGGTYVVAAGGYANGGTQPDAPDILQGWGESDSLVGLGGNDGLHGGWGDDLLDGGNGNDLLLGGVGVDTLNGGAGDDIIFGSAVGDLAMPTDVNFTLPALPPNSVEAARGFSWVAGRSNHPRIGTDSNGNPTYSLRTIGVTGAGTAPGWQDFGTGPVQVESDGNIIDGGAGNDYIAAGTGSDIVHGGDDDDDIVGMDGADTLFGDAGADFIWGDGPLAGDPGTNTPEDKHGNDILVGGAGDDMLAGNGGDDELYGGDDNDFMTGDGMLAADGTPDKTSAAQGDDYLDGGDGNDTMLGDGRDDTLFGGAGNDRIWGDDKQDRVDPSLHGMDYLDGEAGDDFLVGGGNDDELFGGTGNDTMLGDDQKKDLASSAHGNDYMDGEEGNDVMAGGGGNDEMYGGEGDDQLQGDDVAANLDISAHGEDTLNGEAGNDSLFGGGQADVLYGGDGNDYIHGDDADVPLASQGADWLEGGAGDDTLLGDGGNDTLTGGSGTDYLAGGAGNDTYRFEAGDGPLGAGGATEVIVDAEGVNTVAFGSGISSDALMVTASGSDLVIDYAGGDRLVVTRGVSGSFAAYEFADGSVLGADQLVGRFSDVVVTARDDSNHLHVLGGRGNDSVSSSEGDATLSGGHGDDILTGAGGNNRYLFSLGDGRDTVTDAKGTNPVTELPQATSRVAFASGIASTDVHLSVGSDGALALNVGLDPADGLSITGFNAGNVAASDTNIDAFAFADGTVLNLAQLLGRGFDIGGTQGNDVLTGTSVDDRFDGGIGNDTQRGGAGADVYQWGVGAGQDVIDDGDAGASIDTLRVGVGLTAADLILNRSGNDLVVRQRGGNDQVTVINHFGGAGLERIVLDDGTTWDAAAIAVRISNELTDAADGYTGTAADEFIDARGGNDTVHGGAGNDVIDGGSGNDSLFGDAGNDSLSGGAGNDTLTGGAGADVYLFGTGSGIDSVSDGGTDGAVDVLRLGAGITTQNVKLSGTAASLTLTLTASGEAISFAGPGGTTSTKIERIEFADGAAWTETQWAARALQDAATNGDDVITAFYNTDTSLVGLGGNDRLTSYAGNDSLDGGVGDDRLDSGGGNDTLIGDAGNDSLFAGDGNDWLDGGAGSDWLDGGAGNDTLKDGDTMYGGAGDDTYVLSAWQSVVIGEYSDVATNKDRLVLPVGVTPNALIVDRGYNSSSKGYDDLALRTTTPGSSFVVLTSFYANQSSDNKVEEIAFSDGTIWTVADVFMHDKYSQATQQADSLQGFRWNNVIDGLGGNDRIDGLQGDDQLSGSDGNDTVFGDAGNDLVRGGTGNDSLYGDDASYASTTDGSDTLDGGAGNDVLYGADGNDTYMFGRGAGADKAYEAAGTDRILLASGVLTGDVTLLRNGADLVLAIDASATQLSIVGHFSGTATQVESVEFADGTIWDAAAIVARTVTGTANAMTGTAGNDTFVVDNTGDTITEAANQGIDTVQAAVNFTLGANLENLTLTGYLNSTGTGNTLNNVITGNAGHNMLVGGTGADSIYGNGGDDVLVANADMNGNQSDAAGDYLEGGAGDDIYYIGIEDTVVEAAGAGTDTVMVNGSYTLGANVENLAFYGPSHSISAQTYTGNGLDNVIRNTSMYRTDVYDGGAGADTMISAAGGGTFYVDNLGDVIVSGNGDNSGVSIKSSISWALTPGWTTNNLELLGNASINATGNDYANVLLGNTAANVLTGGGGNDSLDGQGGSDMLVGGTGDDTYTLRGGENVLEQAGEGIDTVIVASNAVATYSLSAYANIENLTLLDGATTSNLLGDAGNNVLYGNAYANRIEGLDGDDRLSDGTGYATDTLLGGNGNDTLISNAGGDWLDGGTGNDTLWLGDPGSVITTVVFGRGYGADLVNASPASLSRRVLLNADLTPNDLQVLRNGADLQLAFGQGDVLTITGYFVDSTSNTTTGLLGRVEFTDGSQLDPSMLLTRLLNGNSNTAGAMSDVLLGSTLADTLSALAGDDALFGLGGNDVLAGGTGTDTVWGGAGDDSYLFARGDGQDVIVETGGAQDAIVLAAGITTTDVAVTRLNNDLILQISGGTDRILVQGFFGGVANEIEALRFSDGTVWDGGTLKAMSARVNGTAGNDVLTGTPNDDQLYGLAGNDSLAGSNGNDLLDGGSGADTMDGGLGDDIYYVDNASDVVTEVAGQGGDTVFSSVSIALSANVETLSLLEAGAINGTGNASSNIINGNSAANTLNGAAGADTMAGGGGDDIYIVDNMADTALELAGQGSDLVQSGVTFTLGVNVENLTLTGSATISGTGNTLDNVLIGNGANNTLTGGAGNDTLDGGLGNDSMIGGVGNDNYLVNASTDVVTENANEGMDTVQSTATFTLGANVENLTLSGSTAINGTGNTLANLLTGNGANNALTGGAGNDTLDGGLGNDTMLGGTGDDVYVVNAATDVVTESASEGADTVLSTVTWTLGTNVENLTLTGSAAANATGNALNNLLTGNSTNNTINGGTGFDTMRGAAGDDTYVVDDTADVVIENSGEGVDLVQTSVTFTLGSNVENLTLTGSIAISGTGNTLDNVLTGNSANNTLTGAAGNDMLDGGAGNDTMLGGVGNDTYVVNVGTDVVTENAGEGTDTVQSAVTWTLGGNLENLTLTGSTTINGTGNALDNLLIGNSANNALTGAAGNDTLDGGAGNDTMLGGAGNDVYVVNIATDVVTENASEGSDTVQSVVTWTLGANLENLTLTGSSAINGTGNALANVLLGNGGANTLIGGEGNDSYDGGAGNDQLTDTSTTSSDAYLWGLGSGTDTVADSGGALDHVDLFAGVTRSQLVFKKNVNNLEVTIAGGADKLVVNNWYVSSANQIEEFRLADGSKVLASEVQGLLSAMAVFDVPASTADTANETMSALPVWWHGTHMAVAATA